MADPASQPTAEAPWPDRVKEASQRIARAEAFVRDLLIVMGQPHDAEDEQLVRDTAQRVLLAIYGRKLPR